MPTIVYLVHGMGCGSADGTPRSPHDAWSRTVVQAMQWIASTFHLPAPALLDPLPDAPPPGSDDPGAIWLVPVHYFKAFDEFRASSTDRAALAGRLGLVADADITKLTSVDFAWINCLDVFLWWADRAQTRPRVTAEVLETITAADRLAAKVPGATTRRLLVSHSLGTAVTTWALRNLGQVDAWVNRGGFQAWFTLANVSPFLLQTHDVYAPPLVPGADGSIVPRYMFNARNEFDPIPWLMPWRVLDPANAGADAGPWRDAAAARRYSLVRTQGVAVPPGETPDVMQVHGFANYLMAPDVALPLAGLLRGAAFSRPQQTALGWPDAWKQLPALRCTRNGQALDNLRAAVNGFVDDAPNEAAVPGEPDRKWVGRLLRATEILLAARDEC